MDTVELHEIAKDWFFSNSKEKMPWPTITVMLTHFGEHLLKQCSDSQQDGCLFANISSHTTQIKIKMKAKVLVSYYRGEGAHTIHRIYLEQHFDQAEADLKMIQSDGSSSKEWELQETEIYNCPSVKTLFVRSCFIVNEIHLDLPISRVDKVFETNESACKYATEMNELAERVHQKIEYRVLEAEFVPA